MNNDEKDDEKMNQGFIEDKIDMNNLNENNSLSNNNQICIINDEEVEENKNDEMRINKANASINENCISKSMNSLIKKEKDILLNEKNGNNNYTPKKLKEIAFSLKLIKSFKYVKKAKKTSKTSKNTKNNE